MASYAGAYGAGGASDELHKLLSERFERDKFAEVQRRGKADEDARERERTDRSSFHAQQMAAGAARDEAERSENHENRIDRRRMEDTHQKERTDNAMVRAKERADDREWGLDDRESARKARIEAQRFQERLMAAQRGPVDEMKRLQIEGEKKKQADAAEAAKRQEETGRQSTQSALDSVGKLLDPNGIGRGLEAASGAWDFRKGRTQEAIDFAAERDRLAAMLALPNMGLLKGTMSDNDLLFLKQISSKLSNDNVSDSEVRNEIIAARDFLQKKLPPIQMQAPDGSVSVVKFSDVAHYESLGAKRIQ